MVDKIIPQRSELEKLTLKTGQVTNESLESTRRMVQLMEESEQAGRRTIEALDEQRERIIRVEEGMNNINNDMARAEKAINNLKSCCNVCTLSWKKIPIDDKCTHISDAENVTNMQQTVVINEPRSLNNDTFTKSSVPAIPPSSGYITRITNDAREDEMDSNLCQVNTMLGNLRSMAIDMNNELKTQNGKLDEIITMADSNNIRLDQVNISANNLLNKK